MNNKHNNRNSMRCSSPHRLAGWIAVMVFASALLATPFPIANAASLDRASLCKKPAQNKKAEPKQAGKKKKGKAGNPGGGGGNQSPNVIRPEILNWIKANNPGLGDNFLKNEEPGRVIKLPGDKSIPIYKTKQFLEVNFRLTFFARRPEGSQIVSQSEYQLRRLLATPEFRQRVLTHRGSYKVNGKKMSSKDAYDYIRDIKRHLGATASDKVKAPVGGGSGINAPSWAVWKAMNLFWHEACHCIGINHDSGGLSGPIAGDMRQWDRKKLWNYETVDLNAIQLPQE